MIPQTQSSGTPREAPALAPVTERERITALDVLRGFAVLGILAMNIQAFAMIIAAYLNPTAYGDLTGANRSVWLLTHVLVDQKFMTIFSMLFGAGIVLMTSRVEARGQPSAGLHYRRMGWLILFGLLHGYLLWSGDILYWYGMCGLIVYLFRKLPPGRLLVFGLLAIAVASGLWLFFGWSMQFWPPEVVKEFTQGRWQPPPELVAREVAAYRGSWLEQMALRVPGAFAFQTFLFLILGLWRAGGLMLVGMALFKWGMFSAKRSPVFYLALIAVAVLVGIPTILYGVHRNFAAGWEVRYSFFFGSQFNYWASILASLGWVGLIMLACQKPALAALTRPFAAVGQMAFTNYLLQTIICTTVFYGHGFGQFGQVERVGQIALVAAVWAFQLIVSPLWLRHFLFGPFEWLWRSLTYLRFQPIRRQLLQAAR